MGYFLRQILPASSVRRVLPWSVIPLQNEAVIACMYPRVDGRSDFLKYHAKFHKSHEGGWLIKDMNSPHGVYVNDEKIGTTMKRLAVGDRIRFGMPDLLQTVLSYVYELCRDVEPEIISNQETLPNPVNSGEASTVETSNLERSTPSYFPIRSALQNEVVIACMYPGVAGRPGLLKCHAIFHKSHEGGWLIKDMNSPHGVYVNDEKVGTTMKRLADGDRIRFGMPDFLQTVVSYDYELCRQVEPEIIFNEETSPNPVNSGEVSSVENSNLEGSTASYFPILSDSPADSDEEGKSHFRIEDDNEDSFNCNNTKNNVFDKSSDVDDDPEYERIIFPTVRNDKYLSSATYKDTRKVLLTDPKPMTSRPLRMRARDEGFVDRKKPYILPVSKRSEHGRPRKNAQVGKKSIGKSWDVQNKILSPSTSRRNVNIPVSRPETQNSSESSKPRCDDVFKKRISTVKVRPERFSSRGHFLTNETELKPLKRKPAVASEGKENTKLVGKVKRSLIRETEPKQLKRTKHTIAPEVEVNARSSENDCPYLASPSAPILMETTETTAIHKGERNVRSIEKEKIQVPTENSLAKQKLVTNKYPKFMTKTNSIDFSASTSIGHDNVNLRKPIQKIKDTAAHEGEVNARSSEKDGPYLASASAPILMETTETTATHKSERNVRRIEKENIQVPTENTLAGQELVPNKRPKVMTNSIAFSASTSKGHDNAKRKKPIQKIKDTAAPEGEVNARSSEKDGPYLASASAPILMETTETTATHKGERNIRRIEKESIQVPTENTLAGQECVCVMCVPNKRPKVMTNSIGFSASTSNGHDNAKRKQIPKVKDTAAPEGEVNARSYEKDGPYLASTSAPILMETTETTATHKGERNVRRIEKESIQVPTANTLAGQELVSNKRPKVMTNSIGFSASTSNGHANAKRKKQIPKVKDTAAPEGEVNARSYEKDGPYLASTSAPILMETTETTATHKGERNVRRIEKESIQVPTENTLAGQELVPNKRPKVMTNSIGFSAGTSKGHDNAKLKKPIQKINFTIDKTINNAASPETMRSLENIADRPSLTRKAISLPSTLSLRDWNSLLSVNVSWLKDQSEIEDPSSHVEVCIRDLPLSFESYESYVSHLIKLEIVEHMFAESKKIYKSNKEYNSFHFTIISSYTCNTTGFKVLKCEFILNEELCFAPRKGMIIILEPKENPQNYDSLVGYMHSVEPLNLNSLKSSKRNMQNAQRWIFDCCIKDEGRSFKENDLMEANGVYDIQQSLKLADALCRIKDSPLLEDILRPRFSAFKLESSQQIRIIKEISAKVDPGIILLHGPPGTGRTHALVDILQRMFYSSKYKSNLKVLVTAPTSYVLDEIGCQLIEVNKMCVERDNYINIVRAGSEKHLRDKMLPYFLDRKAKDLHYKRKKNELEDLNARISILEEGPSAPHNRNELKSLREYCKKIDKEVEMKKVADSTLMKYKIDILKKSHIILASLNSLSMLQNMFESDSDAKISFCIVDDSTQSTELEILEGLKFGVTKLMLIGDDKHVPMSMFERLSSFSDSMGEISP